MKISVNLMQQYAGDVEIMPEGGIDALVARIGSQLGAVEEVIDLSQKYQGIVIAKVVSCGKHPDADKLHVCQVDDGGITQNVDRLDNGLIQVVCGAPNVQTGQLIVWLPPGSVVPATFDKEPFTLEAREIRGVVSNGMIASAKELDISDNHDGILVLPDNDPTYQPGVMIADALRLDDYIIDIENKMFTHRPDCFGQLGVAREIAGITGQPFVSPNAYLIVPKIENTDDSLQVKVVNELPELVPRFMLQVFEDVSVTESPIWLQSYLNRLGVRPINNVVDLTNYFMVLTGQPMHAYDYDKVKALNGKITSLVVRHPRSNETLKLLNGKEITPRPEAIMIATDKQLVGVGGVMGGSETEVDEQTKNIILECANFDMYSIRRTSMEHGLFTDAVTRFTKGQSAEQCDRVMAWAQQDMLKLTGARPGNVYDNKQVIKQFDPVQVEAGFINARLGLELAPEEIAELLINVEFAVEVSGQELHVTAPFWRTDIEIPEDMVEEVGRLYGYDHLPQVLPARPIRPVARNQAFDLRAELSSELMLAGANEVLTYSFVHGDLLQKVGQTPNMAYKLSNALSPDLQYYRLSMMPSLLDKIHMNVKAGHETFALFEIGKVHMKGVMAEEDPALPQEDEHLALVVVADDKQAPNSSAYYLAKNYFEQIAPNLVADLVPLDGFDFKDDAWGQQMAAPYQPNRSAAVVRDGLIWGVVGEFKPAVQRSLKLPRFAAGFEVSTAILRHKQLTYQPISKYPRVEQDITLKIEAGLSYGELFKFVNSNFEAPGQTNFSFTPIAIYQPENSDKKHVTFRLQIASYEQTLTDQAVNQLLDDLAAKAGQQFGAERI